MSEDISVENILAEWAKKHGKAPSIRTIWNWLKATPEFKDEYEYAKKMQGRLLAERATNEAYTPRIGTVVEEGIDFKGNPYTKTRTVDNVERSKLIIYTLFQRAKQLAPSEYSDKASVEVSGPGGGSIPVSLEIDL